MALNVAVGSELIDELGRGLPGDIQVLSELSNRGTASGQPREGEAVGRAHIVKSAGGDSGGDPVYQRAAGSQEPERQGLGIVVSHRSTLTD